MLDILITTLSTSFRTGSPLILAGLGEVFAERSGVLNLGIEGMMLMGCFAGFWASLVTGNLWAGIMLGMIVGSLFGFLMAFLSITLCADQVVSGIAITIAGTGISGFLSLLVFGGQTPYPRVDTFPAINIPVLNRIPILGQVLFQQNILVYLTLILVFVGAFVLFRTNYGLKIRAVGENPRAADTLGINVSRIRYQCVMFGGLMAGLAGAYFILVQLSTFRGILPPITAGRGFITIALVMFGRWNPYGVLGAALLFSGVDAFQMRLQTIGVPIASEFLLLLPYIVIIIFTLAAYKRALAPASLGIPHVKSM